MMKIKKYDNPVIFAGAGPGAADLITLRCRKVIEEADLIIFAGSLVNPEILDYAEDSCEILDSAGMDLEATTAALANAVKEGMKAVRLHTGDPSVYGAIAEQMRELDKLGIVYEVIPGVSSVFASAAALNAELTLPGISQSVILTRRAGRTPVPEGQNISDYAKHRATMAIFLTVSEMDALVSELLDGGYSAETVAAVVYRASWDNQKIVKGTLLDIAEKTKKAGITRQAIILVGDSINGIGEKSRLYDASFSHGYRKASCFNGKVAVYAITEKGSQTAAKFADSLDNADLFVPARFRNTATEAQLFDKGEFSLVINKNWKNYDAHLFVMATGIVVRKIAKLQESKIKDPAVVVSDENGDHLISLLSGHIGGANRLAQTAAAVTGGIPVITTATDVQELMAFDELASCEGWEILNPGMIKGLNSMLLEGRKIGLLIPEEKFNENYGKKENLLLLQGADVFKDSEAAAAVMLDVAPDKIDDSRPVLFLKKL